MKSIKELMNDATVLPGYYNCWCPSCRLIKGITDKDICMMMIKVLDFFEEY